MPRRPSAAKKAHSGATAEASREVWSLIFHFIKAKKQTSLAEFDLTQAQAQLLGSLEPDRPIAMNELANTLGCDASNVTGLVDRLEERGLLERRTSAEDRRMKMIAVTTSGEKQRRKLLELWHEPPRQIADLPLGDLKELLRILRKAAES
jgi:MarR family transcriptional regulator, organic hydroperoxide resistance regulator